MTGSEPRTDPPAGESPTSSVAGAVETLDPAYFGFVMATGIVALAFLSLGIGAVAWPLAAVTVGGYAVLLVLFAVRVVWVPRRVLADLRDRRRHWGALTFVVATNTVGLVAVRFADALAVAAVLWVAAAVLTPLLLYYLFATEVIGAAKAGVAERVDGAFLLVVVCLQSLAILGVTLSAVATDATTLLVLASASYFGAGYLLYVVVVTVVTYRLLDGALRPHEWTGPYWITMGAAAITTHAGATLGPRLGSLPEWAAYAPSIVGLTVLAWAIATWWIPLLLVLDVWAFLRAGVEDRAPAWVLAFPWTRLAAGRRLHTYDPAAWGRVFPIGMYTAGTLSLAGVTAFAPLAVVSTYWGWFALVVWTLTFVGLLRAVGRVTVGSPSERPGSAEGETD